MPAIRNPYGPGATGPASAYVAIVKSDTVDFAEGPARGIYVGVSGDVAVVGLDDVAVVFKAAPVGILNVVCRRVNSTATTATNMVALY